MKRIDDTKLIAMCKEGLSLQEIGNALGVSRQRVHQLVHSKRVDGLSEIRLQAARVRWLKSRIEASSVKIAEANRKFGSNRTRKEFYSDSLLLEQQGKLNNKRANCRGKVEFDLQWGDLEWPSHCPVLGMPLDYFSSAGKRSEDSASFDRLDNTLGYIKGNVRIISWRANRIKNNGTADEHRKIADYIDSCM